ncbi:MAG TPA: hypothetical protein VF412_14360 [Bdellovibrio sp.]|uniref:hypothetical protein n=1 Tax=Bdellovibrio sp. TaxID=28201 RepID=UPI002F24FE88
MAAQNAQVRKNLTKAEFKLFNQSSPKELKNISRRSLNSAMLQTEKLLRKYRTSKNAKSEEKARLLEFRLKSLTKVRARFAKKMQSMDKVKAKPAIKAKRSLTPQPKMKVELKDTPRNNFIYKDQKKQYSKHAKEETLDLAAGRRMSKRIAGFEKARSRKGQVARDRVTSAKEQ